MPRRIPYADTRPREVKEHRPADKAERDAFYSSARWRKTRAVFLRSHPLCVDCEAEGKVIPATIAHHVEERLARPDLALDQTNLLGLCSEHHTRRHKTIT